MRHYKIKLVLVTKIIAIKQLSESTLVFKNGKEAIERAKDLKIVENYLIKPVNIKVFEGLFNKKVESA